MQCAFCGTENRPEHKFCGMCGVKLERRVAERRVQSGVSIKCDSCGHMNEPGLKFCGMCGARVERRLQERRGTGGDQARAGAIANAQLPRPDVARKPPPRTAVVTSPDLPSPGARRGESAIFHDESANAKNGPHISGPSFLGLNSQPEEGSGEYLLEDEPSGGGLRKFILLLILAAIVGLVFVQWKSSFKASPKPAPAKTEPAPATAPQGNNQPPATTSTDQPAKDADAKNGTGTASVDEAKKEADTPIAAAPSNAKATADDPAAADSDSKNADSKDADTKDADSKKPPESDGKPGPNTKAIDDAHIPDHKPSAALVRAQQYLRGRGVPQNCEQGMLYLRAATEKNDPEAAIQMAALYTSGLCVKQDRVMAYRWFNSAHELEPANTWIQKNMDQLWAQMTSQERRLAGY